MSSYNPLISIVIPVYNGENYMREAIDSAINQTYSNIEIIVVNDGSTDNTEQIALEYGDRIRYFAKENGGVSSALNLGIKEMRGEYFQYLPHDDLISVNKLERQINAIIASGKDKAIVWSDWEMYLQNDNIIRRADTPYEHRDILRITKGIYPLLFNFITIVTVLFPKEYLDMAGEFDPELLTSQDYDIMFRTFQGRDTIYIDEPLVRYRWHDQQGTQADSSFIENCKAIAKKIQENVSEEEILRMFHSRERYYYSLLEHYKYLGWEELFIENYTGYKAVSKSNSEAADDVWDIFFNEFNGGVDKDSGIYLYCAGRNGKRLGRYLFQRDIPVAGFIDGNRDLIGSDIDGVSCFDLDKADKNRDIIIVTKDNPEELEEEIRGRGYRNVTSFKKIGAELFYILPDKEKVINSLAGGVELKFYEDKSQKIYDDLINLSSTGDVEYLCSALRNADMPVDECYTAVSRMERLKGQGKKLVLYGIGKAARRFFELELKRRNSPGYLYHPFFTDIDWYAVGDSNIFGEGFLNKKIESPDTLLSRDDENTYYYIAAPDYFKEIASFLADANGGRIDTERILKYPYPDTRVFEDRQYFDDFVVPKKEGIVIDGGCFRCDSLERFISWNKGFGYERIISFEPDTVNYGICRDIIAGSSWENVELVNGGLSDIQGSLNIVENADDTTYLTDDEATGRNVPVYGIDKFLENYSERLTFIKLDVEGFELKALRGAKERIKRERPRMAISLYHKKEDLREIPEYILSLNRDYRFYLRIYSNAYLEIVLYAL